MTRLRPGMPIAHVAMQQSQHEQQQQPPPSASNEREGRSREFILADMEGRNPQENRICSACMTKLTAGEACQVTWQPNPEDCRMCQVAAMRPEGFIKPFCDFLQDNPTTFHAVDYFKRKLTYLGFVELTMRESWADKLRPGGKYWTTRNNSSLIAFTVGKAYKPGNGVAMIGAHIDALAAPLKPASVKQDKAGYVQLSVARYGGALNHTWWDRDLSVGGRVIVRDEETGKTSTRLVKLGWPIARIPTLAPHFGLGMMGDNNPETQAVPIIGLEGSPHLPSEPVGPPGCFVNSQPPRLVQLIAKELGIQKYSTIMSWDLELFDIQPAVVGGMDREFLFAGRLDDKLCAWPAVMGLLAANDNEDEGTIKLVALFDDEEIGSQLRQGAKSDFLPQTIQRAVEALSPAASFGPGLLGQTYSKSFLLSADVTHAGNPNFISHYADGHVPKLNTGITICHDANGHMTTDGIATAILQRVGELTGCTTQHFQIRNDTRSGGTIGPSLSTMMGVKAADAGVPQLSMHSIRATTGALDPGLGVQFFKGFYDNWEKIDAEWH